jgi:serine/threonine protein kinase
MKCTHCGADALDIDVKCGSCGAALAATGAHRMVGQIILGTYELVDVIGQGGMSVVFKARHNLTEQEVALKILPPELAAHSQVKSRFLEEAKALAALDHPNIVHLYNFGEDNGSFVLAMQYMQGVTWERLVLEQRRLDWRVSVRIAIDVLKALEYAHGRGVIHRDMKPSNVLVRANDGLATVMDFGIAKMTTSTRLTATGQTMGTVRYMSPEQVRGQEVDLRTDIYSLGASLYESLTGDTPFDGQTHYEIMTKHLSEAPKRPSSLGVELPGAVEEGLMRSLAKRPDDRWPTARDIRKLLEVALREGDAGLAETSRLHRELFGDLRAPRDAGAGPAPTAPSSAANDLADALEPGRSASRPGRRSRWPWLLAAVVLLGGGATAAALLLGRSPTYHPQTSLGGIELTEGKRFDDLRVLVETDGQVTPDQVADAYRAALAQLVAFDPKVPAQFRVLDAIVAVPTDQLCKKTIMRASAAPCIDTAEVAVSALGNGGSHVMVVDDAREHLAQHVREGLAQAVCDFQPAYLDAHKQSDQELLKTVCDLTARFKAADDRPLH